jgi:hypothetical protein
MLRKLSTLIVCILLATCAKTREGVSEEGKPREQAPLPTPIAAPSSSDRKQISSQLIVWIRSGKCKRAKVLCERKWETLPQPDNDPCFPVTAGSESGLRPDLPAKGCIVYRLTQVTSGLELSADTTICLTEDDSSEDELAECPSSI